MIKKKKKTKGRYTARGKGNHHDDNERLLLNHKRRQNSWPPEEKNYNPGPETRLDHSELLCNEVLLKYKRDRESF